MKTLLLGASGRTGRLLAGELLRRGYEVNCLLRDPKKITVQDSRMQIFQGTPANENDLAKALQGCDAIMSALNVSRKSDFPWSPLRTPKTFLSDVMTLLIPLAERQNIQRIIVCSAWGASDTKKDIPGWFRWFIDNSNIGYAYRDHERQEVLIINSKLCWTIVRPTGLTNAKSPQKIVESYDNTPRPGFTISRQSVAKFMTDALQNPNLINKAPVISGK